MINYVAQSIKVVRWKLITASLNFVQVNRIIGMTELPLMMLSTEQISWFKHSNVLNGLSCGIARLVD